MQNDLPQSSVDSVTVIVPVHQDDESFRCCLKSISQASPPPDEVIVVDDGVGPGIGSGAGESVRSLVSQMGYRWLEGGTSIGPARARNRGAFNARGSLLFFVDSDVAIPSNAIAQARRIFSQIPGLAAFIGSYDDQPAAKNFLSQYRNLFHHYIHQNSNEDASTFWGACGVIRREVFQKLGGFGKQYLRPCVEDIELGNRLKKAGYTLRLSKAFQCKHLKQYGIRSLLKSDFLDRALPWTELILRDRAMINDLNLRISSRLSVALVFAIIGLLIVGFWKPSQAGIAMAVFAMFLAINLPLYRFYYTKRGLWFMVKAIPWHCIYYLCCGLAFTLGVFRILLKGTGSLLGRIFARKKSVCFKKSI
jgi:GT2 family glycosyltransferase